MERRLREINFITQGHASDKEHIDFLWYYGGRERGRKKGRARGRDVPQPTWPTCPSIFLLPFIAKVSSSPYSASQPPLPHFQLFLTPSPVVLPLCHSTKLLFSRFPETSVLPNPAVTLMRLTASSDRKHFISELPGFSLSWLCSQAFLPSHPTCLQTSKAPGLAGLSALSCLIPCSHLVSVALNPATPPIYLQPQLSPEHQLRVSTGLFVISTCSSKRPVQNRTLNFYPQNYISLKPWLLSASPHTQAINTPGQYNPGNTSQTYLLPLFLCSCPHQPLPG